MKPKAQSRQNAIVWFRQDLRLRDNPALRAALAHGGAVIPVFIWAPEEEGAWPPGAASRWWLHHSLTALRGDLRAIGSDLVIRTGPTLETLRKLCAESNASAVFWNRRYEPAIIKRDQTVKHSLREAGFEAHGFNAALLHEPWTIENQSGKPFQVFTPYWRACLAKTAPEPLVPAPRTLPPPAAWPKSLALEALSLLPKLNWADRFPARWQPGEIGAHQRLEKFLTQAFEDYSDRRNYPDSPGTSRLSPHLHFGEISPRQIWHKLRQAAEKHGWPPEQWCSSQFLAEIGWREFAHHLLYHFPRTPEEPLRPQFAKFPWRNDVAFLKTWQRGRTGYPIVDAGLRELWATGWMHNRVRMITASFLVKDLLLSWTEGARWFWDTLVDADLAQNTLGWQWTAGCGADAAPYFRIFNPVSQGEKFDPKGDYVRCWCPELSRLPATWIHQPWKTPAEVLAAAGLRLGREYPKPILPHSIARDAALEAFAKIKTGPSPSSISE